MTPPTPTMPEGSCHLCWLKERHEAYASKMDLCLSMAFNLGRLMESGLTPNMCNEHVEIIQKQLGDLQDQIEADPSGDPLTAKALDS